MSDNDQNKPLKINNDLWIISLLKTLRPRLYKRKELELSERSFRKVNKWKVKEVKIKRSFSCYVIWRNYFSLSKCEKYGKVETLKLKVFGKCHSVMLRKSKIGKSTLHCKTVQVLGAQRHFAFNSIGKPQKCQQIELI